MSLIDLLDSEPELLSSELYTEPSLPEPEIIQPVNATENKSSSKKKVKASSPHDNERIFIVSIDGIPKFYTKSKEEALKSTYSYLKFASSKLGLACKYNIEQVSENEFHLISIYKFSIIKCDFLEHVATISSIPKYNLNVN